MTTTALSGGLAVSALVLSAGARPTRKPSAPGKTTHQIHSAIAALDIPAQPVSPAGAHPAVSSLDLAGAISSLVAPAPFGEAVEPWLGQICNRLASAGRPATDGAPKPPRPMQFSKEERRRYASAAARRFAPWLFTPNANPSPLQET